MCEVLNPLEIEMVMNYLQSKSSESDAERVKHVAGSIFECEKYAIDELLTLGFASYKEEGRWEVNNGFFSSRDINRTFADYVNVTMLERLECGLDKLQTVEGCDYTFMELENDKDDVASYVVTLVNTDDVTISQLKYYLGNHYDTFDYVQTSKYIVLTLTVSKYINSELVEVVNSETEDLKA